MMEVVEDGRSHENLKEKKRKRTKADKF